EADATRVLRALRRFRDPGVRDALRDARGRPDRESGRRVSLRTGLMATTQARFEGFADRDGRFFRLLARNQRREWFQMHREEYERGWLGPMKALLDELRERIDPFFPQHPLAPPKVFRIHRDVRFAKDKSPYKTHIGGFLAIEGAGNGPSVPAPLYLHVSPTEVFAAAGHYVMDPGQLARFRAAV